VIERLQLGPMANFVYLIVPPGDAPLAVVDPAWQPDAILARAAAVGRPISDIILTHHHPDHRNGVDALLDAGARRVHVQRAELPWLRGLGWADHTVAHDGGDVVAVGDLAVTLLHTPGHTPGSQCLLCGDRLLTGDTLFIDGCGRCDLPGGDAVAMFDTLRGLVGRLPAATRVLPGHDYAPVAEASLGDQLRTNPYLAFSTLDGFISWRMRPRG